MDGKLFPRMKMEGHEFTVWSLAITPNGTNIVSGGQDSTVRVWDLIDGKVVHMLSGHEGAVYALAITSDGHRIVSSADMDFGIRIWDLQTGSLISTLAPNSSHVTSLTITPDDRYLILRQSQNILWLYDLEKRRTVRSIELDLSFSLSIKIQSSDQ